MSRYFMIILVQREITPCSKSFTTWLKSLLTPKCTNLFKVTRKTILDMYCTRRCVIRHRSTTALILDKVRRSTEQLVVSFHKYEEIFGIRVHHRQSQSLVNTYKRCKKELECSISLQVKVFPLNVLAVYALK